MGQLFAAPAQVTISDAVTLANQIVINKDQQVDDLVVSLEKQTFELMSQSSSYPDDYIQTGVSLRVTLSLGDTANMTRYGVLAAAFSTTFTKSGVSPNEKFKLQVFDQAGIVLPGKNISIKPYVGESWSGDANTYLTIYNAKIIDLSDTELSYGLSTQQQLKVTFIAARPTSGPKFMFGDVSA